MCHNLLTTENHKNPVTVDLLQICTNDNVLFKSVPRSCYFFLVSTTCVLNVERMGKL